MEKNEKKLTEMSLEELEMINGEANPWYLVGGAVGCAVVAPLAAAAAVPAAAAGVFAGTFLTGAGMMFYGLD